MRISFDFEIVIVDNEEVFVNDLDLPKKTIKYIRTEGVMTRIKTNLADHLRPFLHRSNEM